MKSWRRIVLEVYDANGFRGRYESAGPTDRSYDELQVARFLREAVRPLPGALDAPIRCCVDGEDFIVAIFLDGHAPDFPKRGHPFTLKESLDD